MNRYTLFLQCLLVFSSISSAVEYINVVNPGFEEPNEGKISDDFSRIPGWSQYYTADSGVEALNPSAGRYRGFGQSSDGMIYQLLAEEISAGAKYTLIFDGASTYQAGVITAEFYYLFHPTDPSAKEVIKSVDFELTQPQDVWMYDLSMDFTAETGQAYISKRLGIQFGCDTGWFGIDEVRVEKITVETEAEKPACDDKEKSSMEIEVPKPSSDEEEQAKELKDLALLALRWLNE